MDINNNPEMFQKVSSSNILLTTINAAAAAAIATFKYNKELMTPNSISDSFVKTSKELNDKNNKTRENIIGAIINKKVPFRGDDWLHIEKETNNYLKELSGYKLYNNVECIHKGGRMYNYDFIFTFSYEDGSNEDFYIELKFNASSIDDAPQFVSPTNPSKFMIHHEKISYEEYFYDKFLPKLLVAQADAQPQAQTEAHALEMPVKEEYISKIHSNNPECMKLFQDKYYAGCKKSSQYTKKEEDIAYYKLANELSRESIRTYIENSELDIGLLSYYLCETQKNKRYMLYNLENRNFTLQKVVMDDYQIVSVIKNAKKYRYECTSKSGKKINVLLRWKNGNGIAFPAFQISSKHKSVSNKSVSNKLVKCDSIQ
jgi:hypothetical protein